MNSPWICTEMTGQFEEKTAVCVRGDSVESGSEK